jgi:hypothetical protein
VVFRALDNMDSAMRSRRFFEGIVGDFVRFVSIVVGSSFYSGRLIKE